MSFWYDAALVVLLAEPYALDFVRHRARQVARELANLLPLLEPDPGLAGGDAPPAADDPWPWRSAAEQRLQDRGVALERAALHVEVQAALAAELLAAAGAAGSAVEQRRQRGAGARALRRHLRRAEVEPAGPRRGGGDERCRPSRDRRSTPS